MQYALFVVHYVCGSAATAMVVLDASAPRLLTTRDAAGLVLQ